VTALFLLALAAAPGCPRALAEALREEPPGLAVRARALVEALEREGAGPAPALAAEARALADVEGRPEELPGAAERFRAQLRAHCALAGTAAPRGAGPSDRARLAEILARPEFGRARADTGVLARWIASLWRRLVDLLSSVEAGRWAAGGRSAFFAALALALGGTLLWLRRRVDGRHAPASRPPTGPAARPLPAPDEGDAAAEEALRRGEAAEALRQAFLGLLAALERAGQIPLGRSLTNREIAARLATSTSTTTTTANPNPTAAPTQLALGFADLAARFDRAVYGRAAVAAGEARACLDRSRALRALAEGGGG
jgi:hypothetical protein